MTDRSWLVGGRVDPGLDPLAVAQIATLAHKASNTGAV